MFEKLRYRFSIFCEQVRQATLLCYGGGAILTDLAQRLEQDLPEPRDGYRPRPAHPQVEFSSIGSRVRDLDGT